MNKKKTCVYIPSFKQKGRWEVRFNNRVTFYQCGRSSQSQQDISRVCVTEVMSLPAFNPLCFFCRWDHHLCAAAERRFGVLPTPSLTMICNSAGCAGGMQITGWLTYYMLTCKMKKSNKRKEKKLNKKGKSKKQITRAADTTRYTSDSLLVTTARPDNSSRNKCGTDREMDLLLDLFSVNELFSLTFFSIKDPFMVDI